MSLLVVLGCSASSTIDSREQPIQRAASDPPNSDSDSKSNAEAAPLLIVVGDDTAAKVVEKLNQAGMKTSTSLDQQSQAALIIMVQDCQQGPIAVHRQLASELKKRPSNEYLWVFTNSSAESVNDPELLELEELECRDLFNVLGLPGDEVNIAFDSNNALVGDNASVATGWDEILEQIRKQLP